MDKGYVTKAIREVVNEKDYIAYIRRIGEEKLDAEGEKRYPARRWVALSARWVGSVDVGRPWYATRRKPPTTWG